MPSVIAAGTTSNTALNFTADTTGVLQLQTNGTTAAVTIDTSQNVGIGTASPLTPLHAVGAIQSQRSGAAQYARMLNSGGTATFISDNQASATYTGFQFQGLSTASGTPVTYATIDGSGNVGIGTTSGLGKLSVKGSDANTLWLVGRASDGTSSVSFRNNADSAYNARIECFDTGVMTFATGTSATERMRIDSSGLVGIGTSSPSSFNAAADNLVVGTTSGNNGITIAGGTTGFSSIYMADGTTGNEAYRGYIEYRHSDDAMAFGTAASERMRIASNGYVGIGNTNPVYPLSIATSVASLALYIQNQTAGASGDTVQIAVTRNTTDGTIRPLTYYNAGAGAYRFWVLDSGNVQNTNGSYGSFSDIKLKENITDASPKLEKLNQVRIVNYNLKGEELKQIGVVAQELEQIFPSMVEDIADKDADGNDLGTTTKAVKYSVFVPILIKAIQELKAELDATKAEVAALKGVN